MFTERCAVCGAECDGDTIQASRDALARHELALHSDLKNQLEETK